jgi:archaellin
VLFDVAGVLQGETASTSQQSSAQLTDRLDVVAVTGNNITETEPHTIREVNVIVTQAGGSDDVDLTNVTAQWFGSDGSYNLLSDRAGDPTDQTFATEALDDPEGTFPVLTSDEQRFALRFTPGTEFGSGGLTAGDRVSIQLTALSRSSTTVRFTVPQSLSGRSSVTL